MKIYFFRLEKITPPLNQYSQLEEMLALRALGWSYGALADRFKVEKITIRYLARRFGLNEEKVKATHFRQSTRTTPQPTVPSYNEVNKGKTYAQYIQEEKDRKWKKLTEGHLKHG